MNRALLRAPHCAEGEPTVYVTDWSLYWGRGAYHRTPACHVLRRRPPRRASGSDWQFPVWEVPAAEAAELYLPCRACYPLGPTERERLRGLSERIHRLMRDGRPRSVRAVAEAVGCTAQEADEVLRRMGRQGVVRAAAREIEP